MVLFARRNREKEARKKKFKNYKERIFSCESNELGSILKEIEEDLSLSKKQKEKLKITILNRQHIKKDVPIEIIEKLEKDENGWVRVVAYEEKKTIQFTQK